MIALAEDRIKEIEQAVTTPLVLHGCSGIPAEQIQRAISLRVSKINVNTELALAASKKIAELLQNTQQIQLEKLMEEAQESMITVMKSFFKLMNSL